MTDMTIRLYIEGNYLCGRLSINEWNALWARYENDPNSKIIDHLDDSENDRDYAVIETTLQTVLDKGAVMDLQFLRAVKEGDKWQTKCLHQGVKEYKLTRKHTDKNLDDIMSNSKAYTTLRGQVKVQV